MAITQFQSDDDHNTTVSDADSQPRTPQTPACHIDNDEDTGQPQYTEDGLFKIPRVRYDSCASTHEQENLVAQRTRSKCPIETPVEIIASKLCIPPDEEDVHLIDNVSTDPEWFNFLNDLQWSTLLGLGA